MVPGDGVEPPTLRFSVACSTNCATRANALQQESVKRVRSSAYRHGYMSLSTPFSSLFSDAFGTAGPGTLQPSPRQFRNSRSRQPLVQTGRNYRACVRTPTGTPAALL